MISTNELSIFIFHQHQNGICKTNLCSIQENVHTSKPANNKFKQVCEDCPNIAKLDKSATTGEVQMTFVHVYVGNKSLGESVTAFSLKVSLDSPSLVLIDFNIAFSMDGDKIRLPFAEVLLCAAAGDLAISKNQMDWMPLNAVLLPPFLTEAEIFDGETSAEDLLKTFARTIMERAEG